MGHNVRQDPLPCCSSPAAVFDENIVFKFENAFSNLNTIFSSKTAAGLLQHLNVGAFIMQVVDIGLSEIDAFSVQYARAFKPRGFRLMFVHSSNWRLAV